MNFAERNSILSDARNLPFIFRIDVKMFDFVRYNRFGHFRLRKINFPFLLENSTLKIQRRSLKKAEGLKENKKASNKKKRRPQKKQIKPSSEGLKTK